MCIVRGVQEGGAAAAGLTAGLLWFVALILIAIDDYRKANPRP
jgi:hypothetical protein